VNCLGDNTPSTPCLLVRTGDILPDFAGDYSDGATKGHMYAVWHMHRTATVQQLGSTVPVDVTIVLSRSTDGGQHCLRAGVSSASIKTPPSTGKAAVRHGLSSGRRRERHARGRYLTGRALGVASGAKGEEGHAALQSYR
jgi:hypothetical protein